MQKKFFGIILIVLLLGILLTAGCTEKELNAILEDTNFSPTNQPSSGTNSNNSSGGTINSENTNNSTGETAQQGLRQATAEDITKSNLVISGASKALSENNKEEFTNQLSSQLKTQIGEAEMDLGEAKKLSDALAGATLIDSSGNILVYQIIIDGQQETFFTIKEGNSWVIDGL